MELKEVAAVSYVASYVQQGEDKHGGAPYLRFFTESPSEPGSLHSVIYSPNTQAKNGSNELFSGAIQAWDVRKGTVRFEDDAGNGADLTWDKVLEEHGDDVIKFLSLQAGDSGDYSAGTTVLVKSLSLDVGGPAPTQFVFEPES
jgi:hypothetical protein